VSHDGLLYVLGLGVVICPALLLAILGLPALVGRPLKEPTISRTTQATVVAGLICAVGVLVLMLITGKRDVQIEVGDWVAIHPADFHFHLKFVFDRLSVPFAILSFVLIGTIGAFANQYLHREPGYGRFFLLYALFLVGMIGASLAGTIEVLFLGWELVGLSSALLVAYFHERPAPVINGQRVWSVYRVADAAFLVAALTLHHLTGGGDFSKLLGSEPWPLGVAEISSSQALFVGLLLLVAAAGKSALIPFSGWLPRAMEGPTPSSAVFYGALSVHLGTFLLLRVGPVLKLSPLLCAVVVTLGVASAIYGTLVGRVQSDVKTALAFASLAQVGIITAEIGLGLRYIPLIHIIGHACLRTLQLVRAPTLLHDYHQLENAIGDHLHAEPSTWERLVPERVRLVVYRLSLERGYLDATLDEFITRPFVRLFRACDALERRWTDFLSGTQSRESDRVPAATIEPVGDELV
jgi:NADH:ubiquinone oxidoreductase subunit 5 (subunit L)/multisubunit Na+/H+ antiporter MnhA subunit